MSRLSVDPGGLRSTAQSLRRSLDVARQVADDHGSLTAHLSEDGEALAAMLEQASAC